MRLGWAIAILMTAATAVVGQQAPEAPDAESALRRTRERLLADLERLPRYTCVQTITRRYYWPPSTGGSCRALMAAHDKRKSDLRLSGWDRLRLEVAIAGGDNVYSWVGAPRFESGTLEQLAGRGPLNTGDFGPFLESIFTQASVTFKGEQRDGKRRLLAYSYEVSESRSRYMVRADADWIRTAYSGELVIDPEAGDIAGLTVRTAELPRENSDCQAISEVDYGRTKIHEAMVLIPRQTRLVTIERQGGETQSVTEYSSCREYASKTRILFDLPPASSTVPDTMLAPVTGPSVVPGGLRFRARIITPIDSDTAAAGDPIEAILRSPIRGKNKAELAPAGARLHGRLVVLEQRSLDHFRVSLQFESLEVKGRTLSLRATPDSSGLAGVGVFRTLVSVTADDVSKDVTNIYLRRSHLLLETFDWSWTTLAAPDGEDHSGPH